MSEEQKAEARAQGALDNFISTMKAEMVARDRSPEYENTFWLSLNHYMQERINF